MAAILDSGIGIKNLKKTAGRIHASYLQTKFQIDIAKDVFGITVQKSPYKAMGENPHIKQWEKHTMAAILDYGIDFKNLKKRAGRIHTGY